MITNSAQYLVFRRGIVYEGNQNQLWALYPTPLISPAVWRYFQGRNLVFREDFFDSVTRIRRGRFYQRHGGRREIKWHQFGVSNGLYGQLIGIHHSGEFDEDDSCELIQIQPDDSIFNEAVRIGEEGAATVWQVVDVEKNIFGQQVFTLRSRSLLGVLPEITPRLFDEARNALQDEKIAGVRESMNALLDIFHRHQAVPTVDAARETARVILAAWIGSKADTKDLQKVIDLIPENTGILRSAAFIVNRLHPRGKSSEQETQAEKGNIIREPTQDDAQTSVNLIGMMLREIGWAAA